MRAIFIIYSPYRLGCRIMALVGSVSNLKNISFYKNVSASLKKIRQKGLDVIPSVQFSQEKLIDTLGYIGKNFSSDKQRLALGVTALATQPFIDAKNRSVDEKTRKVSVARTVAKIIAGTFTGFFIRYGCIKGIKALSQIPSKNIPKIKSLFTPKGVKSNTTDEFEQYRNAMGTVIALVVMVFTNFLIDAPLTKFLTNTFVKHQQKGDKK